MASKLLLRLISEAIIPALMVITAKLVGISLVVLLQGISWSVSADPFLPAISFSSASEYLIVSSWSNLFVIVVICLGLLWVLTKAHYLHNTHVSPTLTLRLLSFDLASLLTTTPEIFQQAIIWISYLWLFIILTGVQAYLGYYHWWMFGVSLALAIILTWLLVADWEKEMGQVS